MAKLMRRAAKARRAPAVAALTAFLLVATATGLALSADQSDVVPPKTVSVTLAKQAPLSDVLTKQLPALSSKRGSIPAGDVVLLYEFKGASTWSGGQVFDVASGGAKAAQSIEAEFTADYEAMLRVQLENAMLARESDVEAAWTWDETIADLRARLSEYEAKGIMLSGYELPAASVDLDRAREASFVSEVVVDPKPDAAALEALDANDQ